MSRREQQFLSLPRTLRSRKSDLTMISFGRQDPYHCQAEPNEKRKEFQLPLIDHIKSLRKHYVTGQRYEEIEGYRKKIYQPQLCARSNRLETVRVHKLVKNTARERPDGSPQRNTHRKTSPDQQTTIETVPLQFLVMKSSTEKTLGIYSQ